MLTTLLLLAFPAPAALQNSGDDQAPAGLIEIPAGRTRIGQTASEAKELIEEHPTDASTIGAQIGEFNADVKRFWIAPTEVTNEMYLRFVEDTGAMPPASWVKLEREQRLAIISKLKENNPGAKLDDATRGVWWEANWQSGEYKWEVSPEEATMPVGFISHNDARAYCKWAGLRLPTEEEWIRAARGDEKDRVFPMGDFNAALVAHNATKPRDLAFKALPVSALNNASSFGVYDLTGNLWEWTDSRYQAFPKFKPFNMKTKKAGKVDVAPAFDASSFVLKGGSFMQPAYACSIDVRAGLQPQFRAPILGFRVASSGVAGLDFARYSLKDISGSLLGGLPEAVLDLDGVIAVEKHRIVPNSKLASKRGEPKKPLPASKLPENYAVFDRADALAMVPLSELNVKRGKMERTVEDEGPVAVGVLFSTVALEAANVLPGSYILMYVPPQEAKTLLELGVTLPEDQVPGNWKPKKLKEGEVSIREIWPTVEGLTIRVDKPYLLLVDKDRTAVSAIELAREPREEKTKTANSSITFDMNEGYLNFQLAVPGAGGNYSFIFNTPIMPRGKDGTLLNPSDWNEGPYQVIEKKEKK